VYVLQHCQQDGVISSANWKLDAHELESKFNSRTKMMLLNNPNNQLGKAGLHLQYTLCVEKNTRKFFDRSIWTPLNG